MSYTLTVESLDGIISSWDKLRHCLKWGSIFILPMWLKVWWEAFGGVDELYLRTVRQGEKIIGFAPLMVSEEVASFVGSHDVSDFLDFAIIAGRERDFFEILLDNLKERGIKKLDLRPVRPDSTVLTQLVGVAQNRGYEVLCNSDDVSLELDLPDSWNEYLATLKSKQRHEVRRKLRRLWETNGVEHRCVDVGREVEGYLDVFLKLFSLSKHNKASFMNQKRERFFRSLAKAMAETGLLRLGILQLDKVPAAMTMGFDYDDSHYLYNSAYDPQFSYLSVGLLCKVLCLKESIERGKRKWNFLKGGEPYKYQLGGQEVPLYSCRITIN
ncbi:MAG: GNAT family N-acetyltransferase [Dehalococcoidia bacterium]|jgi:CelD/BcsL family acetyltransferase involved in cellulose biosynthesis